MLTYELVDMVNSTLNNVDYSGINMKKELEQLDSILGEDKGEYKGSVVLAKKFSEIKENFSDDESDEEVEVDYETYDGVLETPNY